MNPRGRMNRSPFELVLLGSGTCVPQTDSYASGYIVRFAGKTILLDCGPGIVRRMAEAGIDYKTIDAICLTHFHPDHTSDLAPFFLATQYTPGFQRTNPLRIFGPPGLSDFFHSLAKLYGDWIKKSVFPVELREIARNSLSLASLQINSVPVAHSHAAVAYRIAAPDGRSVTYSGDTGFTPALIELAAGTDL
ncbi:MAG TPA: ribonuclease Z, partial [Bacteroidetes bacterium]|nr:ribonuclease Z [Bacteroidota bacterium]